MTQSLESSQFNTQETLVPILIKMQFRSNFSSFINDIDKCTVPIDIRLTFPKINHYSTDPVCYKAVTGLMV